MAPQDDVTSAGIETLQARIDAAALAFMNRRPDLRRMSLDEWLAEHHDALSAEERREGITILSMGS